MRASVIGAGRLRLSPLKLAALLFAIGMAQMAPAGAARADSAPPPVEDKKLTDADLDAMLASGDTAALNSALRNYRDLPSDFEAWVSTRYARNQVLSVGYLGELVRRSRATTDPVEALRLQREAFFVAVFILATAGIDYAKCADRGAGEGIVFLLGMVAHGPKGAVPWNFLEVRKSLTPEERDAIADRVVKLDAETADDRAKDIAICGRNAQILSEAEYVPVQTQARARLKEGVIKLLESGQ